MIPKMYESFEYYCKKDSDCPDDFYCREASFKIQPFVYFNAPEEYLNAPFADGIGCFSRDFIGNQNNCTENKKTLYEFNEHGQLMPNYHTVKCSEPNPDIFIASITDSAGSMLGFIIILCMSVLPFCAGCCFFIVTLTVNYGTKLTSQGRSGLLQTFAGFSGLLLNMGAFSENRDDLTELAIYLGSMKLMNSIFLFLAILQVVLCILDLVVICLGKAFLHLWIMWIEDVLLEIPLLIIAVYLQNFTHGLLTLIFVITGGLLGLLVAVGDTYMEV